MLKDTINNIIERQIETNISINVSDDALSRVLLDLFEHSRNAPLTFFSEKVYWNSLSSKEVHDQYPIKLAKTFEGDYIEIAMLLCHIVRTQKIEITNDFNEDYSSDEVYTFLSSTLGTVNYRNVEGFQEFLSGFFGILNKQGMLYLLEVFETFLEYDSGSMVVDIVNCHLSYVKEGKIQDINIKIPFDKFNHEVLKELLGAEAIISFHKMSEREFENWSKDKPKKVRKYEAVIAPDESGGQKMVGARLVEEKNV